MSSKVLFHCGNPPLCSGIIAVPSGPKSHTVIGVRAGGARGAAAPLDFGQLGFFWAVRENLGKTSFLRRFPVF